MLVWVTLKINECRNNTNIYLALRMHGHHASSVSSLI